jgi:hypothetical protein
VGEARLRCKQESREKGIKNTDVTVRLSSNKYTAILKLPKDHGWMGYTLGGLKDLEDG